ncbi:hypothetical protein FRB99_003919 [Tulasnella sp. 403]|nr:hypothetical protein FRB99_003919 [Tulasnella sp. 403]
MVRFEAVGNVADLEDAILLWTKLLPSLSKGEPLRPIVLHNLGTALQKRYHRKGNDFGDVERAIQCLEEAIALQHDDNPDHPRTLDTLASALRTRDKISQGVHDLEAAIRYQREALAMAIGDHPDRPGILNNLGASLSTRYMRTEDVRDLEEAIHNTEEAISLLNVDDSRRVNCLGNLADMFFVRYFISKADAAGLDKAVEFNEQILPFRADNHPYRPLLLENLSRAYLTRFNISQNMSDMSRGLDSLFKAGSLYAEDHPDRHEYSALFLRVASAFEGPDGYPTTIASTLLNLCTVLSEEMQPDDPRYSWMTSVVASMLPCLVMEGLDTCRLFLAIGVYVEIAHEGRSLTNPFFIHREPDSSPVDATLALYEKASKPSTNPAIHRLEATCNWISTCLEFNRPCDMDMYTRMFDLLDLSIARGCSLETRREQLSHDPNILHGKQLVSEAVAFAIEHGALETAVEFLERGQSILFAQLSRYRPSSVVETLRLLKPDLAARFKELSWQVECATFTEGQQVPGVRMQHPLEDPISRANRLKAEWERVVEEIRAMEGFEHFLRPTPFAVLQRAAAEGPVILVNISESRSDAIIVTSNGLPTVVPLPFATPSQINQATSTFKATPQLMSNRKALNGLEVIWDTIVEPVVTKLQDTLELPKSSRIWWCPTNAVVLLPLHAAGLYRLKDDNCLFTRDCLPSLYTSSYTPTLGALIRAREGRHHYSGLTSVLLVGQSNTPGQTEIPNVRDEIRIINQRIPHSLVLMDERGTHDTVLTAVVQHQWVHLACHGHVKSDNPLRSHFSLYDGPLPLLEVMQQRLPTAEFAFLSACHSASGESDTPDEFLHLAAGMQFAGFRSVVGSMWAMNDDAGPPIVDEFYRRMLPKKAGGNVDHTMAAQALHRATKKLCKDGFPLAVWITFVHWGA